MTPMASTPTRPWTARPALHHAPARVVVAEDDVEMRRLIVEALRRDGYHVIEASDGAQLLGATSHFEPDQIDLIISDVRMPAFTGLQILAALRHAGQDVPVILMTAFGDDQTRERAEALNAILFDKPFSMDDLRTAVVNMLPR